MSSTVPAPPSTAQSPLDNAAIPINPEWRWSALALVKRMARRRETLTSSDVLDELAKSDVTTPDLRAIGTIMREASLLGFIETSGLARQPNNKRFRGISTVWKSLLHKQKRHS